MMRVRTCTMRCRCHSSCRKSRFSQLGTQICGKSSLSISFRISCASCRSVCLLAMRQPLLLELSGVGIHRSNLLKLGMEIYSYNNHRSAPFLRARWLDKHHQLYSGLGADIVMESIAHSPTRLQVTRQNSVGGTPDEICFNSITSVRASERGVKCSPCSKSKRKFWLNRFRT